MKLFLFGCLIGLFLLACMAAGFYASEANAQKPPYGTECVTPPARFPFDEAKPKTQILHMEPSVSSNWSVSAGPEWTGPGAGFTFTDPKFKSALTDVVINGSAEIIRVNGISGKNHNTFEAPKDVKTVSVILTDARGQKWKAEWKKVP